MLPEELFCGLSIPSKLYSGIDSVKTAPCKDLSMERTEETNAGWITSHEFESIKGASEKQLPGKWGESTLAYEPIRLLRTSHPAPAPKLHYSTQCRRITRQLYCKNLE